MGSSIEAHCPCGYESGELMVGGGEVDPYYCGAPALPARKKSVVVANYWEQADEKGNAGLTFYDDPRTQAPEAVVPERPTIFEWHGNDGQPDFRLPDTIFTGFVRLTAVRLKM